MTSKNILVLLALSLLGATVTQAKLKAVTTTTDLAYLVQKIGGQEVEVKALLDPDQDPHFVDALPSYVVQVANADLLCSVGLGLEAAWLEPILRKSGNSRVQSGGKGFCQVTDRMTVLGKPQSPVNRSMGDVHAGGNPHFQLGPKQFLEAANVVYGKLTQLAPNKIEYFTERLTQLEKEIDQARQSIQIKPIKVIEYHREFTYFLNHFGIESAGAIETVPGVPPSAGRLARTAIEAKKNKVQVALASPYSPRATLKQFKNFSGIRTTIAPISIGSKGTKNYTELLQTVARAINGEAKQ